MAATFTKAIAGKENGTADFEMAKKCNEMDGISSFFSLKNVSWKLVFFFPYSKFFKTLSFANELENIFKSSLHAKA